MALIALVPITRAEDFPARPVKIIVQTAAGSSLDVMARLVSEQLSQIWGQQAIVVNQAGAGGLIAARATAASPPDGTRFSWRVGPSSWSCRKFITICRLM